MTTLIIIWLVFLSIIIIYSSSLIFKLFSIKDRGIKQAIYESIDSGKKIQTELAVFKKDLGEHVLLSEKHIQKAALVRFNPFERIGGQQSYCLSLLNEKNTGLVITFLYTKEGVRTYIKEIVLGRGTNIDLSKEEVEAIRKAQTANILN